MWYWADAGRSMRMAAKRAKASERNIGVPRLRCRRQGGADQFPVVADQHVAVCVSRRWPGHFPSRIGIGRLDQTGAADLLVAIGSELCSDQIACVREDEHG